MCITNIAYLLMALGGIGLYVEISHPGLIFPGVLGAISLLISLICFQALPINYGAFALLMLGMGLLVAEAFVTSYGVLAIGGVVSFFLGSVFLIDSPYPEMQVSMEMIIPVTILLAVIAVIVIVLISRNRHLKVSTGTQGMEGKEGTVKKTIEAGKKGRVAVHGELWNATADSNIEEGEEVVVESVNGLVIKVRKN